ncbi:hypothetical protein BDV29DRAFT_181288 [Aspergillus leporis]|uniref:Uncharacterized protein n=1 Tax=Aspergillus leporis TaxID=41062 RepID=A0A5N5WSR5_9EURO|nr:hypothetical protein BDV29DRAFT_181288 [Aspergillus leporis]
MKWWGPQISCNSRWLRPVSTVSTVSTINYPARSSAFPRGKAGNDGCPPLTRLAIPILVCDMVTLVGLLFYYTVYLP